MNKRTDPAVTRIEQCKNDTAVTSVKGKKNDTVVTSATQEEGSGCNEDQATEEDGNTVHKELH